MARSKSPKASSSPEEERLSREIGAMLAGVRAPARVTLERADSFLGAGVQNLSVPDPEIDWWSQGLDSDTFQRMAPSELMEKLVDLSPDMSRAIWDHQRLCNPGWTVRAYVPGTQEVDERAQLLLDTMLATLEQNHGAVDVAINKLFFASFIRGAFFAELVLNRGREFVDIATPDPKIVRFRSRPDPLRGFVWEPYQQVRGTAVSLEIPTVRYIALDPAPGSPYGRSMCTPALFVTLFSLGLLHDLRRVVAQQGYPRLDLVIDLERALKTLPAHLRTDAEKGKAAIETLIATVKAEYAKLEPDDAYVHTDTVSVNRPVGAIDSSSLGAIDSLVAYLERQAIRALKTLPLYFGVNEGASETHANRQAELHSQSVRSVQHLAEQLLEYLLTMALRAQGVLAKVSWRFAELRKTEMMRDEQIKLLQLRNAALAYALGYISQDEAANYAMGRDSADQPEPRVPGAGIQASGGAGDPAAAQPEPGSTRWALTSGPMTIQSGHTVDNPVEGHFLSNGNWSYVRRNDGATP